MMKKMIRYTGTLSLSFAIAITLPVTTHAQAVATQVIRQDFKHYFDAAGTQGTIMVQYLPRNRTDKPVTYVYNPERARSPYLPASTFKIPNSLIAVETGAIKDVDQDLVKWNGKRYAIGKDWYLPQECDADIPLRTAYRFSCVPVYQEIARRVGIGQYHHYLDLMGYGNRQIDHAPPDRFWLRGDFAISAEQQIDFLHRLLDETMPFSARTYSQVKDIMIAERTTGFILRAKTGYAALPDKGIGWYVGWVERSNGNYLFALNMDMLTPEQVKARIDITRAVLTELGALQQD